jgi:copper resistance protein C
MRNPLAPALALGGLLFLYPLLPLEGHAILLSTVPASNETIHGGAAQLQLRFNARIDAKRSRLILVLPGGGDRALTAEQPSPGILTSEVSGLAPGSYILQWQVLAEDGHITRGQLTFHAR